MADDLHTKQSQPWYAMSLKKKWPPFLIWLTPMRQHYLTEKKRKLQTHATYVSYEMEIRRDKCLHSLNSFDLSHLRHVVNRNCPLTSTWICLLARTKMETRAGKDTRWVGNKGKEVYEVQCTKYCISSHLFSFSNSCSCVLFFRLLLLVTI